MMKGLVPWLIVSTIILSQWIVHGRSNTLLEGVQMHKSDEISRVTYIKEDTTYPGRILGLIGNRLVDIFLQYGTARTIIDTDDAQSKLSKLFGVYEKKYILSDPTSFFQQGSTILTSHPKSGCIRRLELDGTDKTTYSGKCKVETCVIRGKRAIRDAVYVFPFDISSTDTRSAHLYVTDGGAIRKIDQKLDIVTTVYEDRRESHIFYRLVVSSDRIFVSSSTGILSLTNNFERLDFIAFANNNSDPESTLSSCEYSGSEQLSGCGSSYECSLVFPVMNLVPITSSVLLAIRCDDKHDRLYGDCKASELTLIDLKADRMTEVCSDHSRVSVYCDSKFMPGYLTVINRTVYITNAYKKLHTSPIPYTLNYMTTFAIRDYCKVCDDTRNYLIGTALQSESDMQPCYNCTLDTHNMDVGWQHCERDIDNKILITNTNQSCLERVTRTIAPTTTTNSETVTQIPTTTPSKTGTIHEATRTETSTITRTKTTTETSTGTVTKTDTTLAISTPRHSSNASTITPDLQNGQNHDVLYICIGVVIAGTLVAVSVTFLVPKIIKRYKSHSTRRIGPLPDIPVSDNQIYNYIGDEFYEVISDPDYDSTNNISRISETAGSIPGDIELQEVYNTTVSDHTQRSNLRAYVDDQTYAIDVVYVGNN